MMQKQQFVYIFGTKVIKMQLHLNHSNLISLKIEALFFLVRMDLPYDL